MKRAGLREFKSHLSSYIRTVRRGESLVLTDRGEVVAEVIPPRNSRRRGKDAVYAEAVLRGEIWPATDRKSWPFKGWKGAGLKPGESQILLDELRADRDE